MEWICLNKYFKYFGTKSNGIDFDVRMMKSSWNLNGWFALNYIFYRAWTYWYSLNELSCWGTIIDFYTLLSFLFTRDLRGLNTFFVVYGDLNLFDMSGDLVFWEDKRLFILLVSISYLIVNNLLSLLYKFFFLLKSLCLSFDLLLLLLLDLFLSWGSLLFWLTLIWFYLILDLLSDLIVLDFLVSVSV